MGYKENLLFILPEAHAKLAIIIQRFVIKLFKETRSTEILYHEIISNISTSPSLCPIEVYTLISK